MKPQDQKENQGGNEFRTLFDKFAIGVEQGDKRSVAFTSLAEILTALKPANATIGHALGILLQFCGDPLESEAIQHVIELLQASIQGHQPEPAPATADPLAAFSEEQRLFARLAGRGQWVYRNLRPNMQTHTEFAIVWFPSFRDGADALLWSSRDFNQTGPRAQRVFAGTPDWAKANAKKMVQQLNQQKVTPPDINANCAFLDGCPFLWPLIQWENTYDGDSAGGCPQPDLAVISRTEEGGGAKEAHSGDYLVDDSIGGGLPAASDAGGCRV